MADLFKSLKPEKHNAKSGFDLSQKHVFSLKAGQLVPCLALETVPDDYHEIDLMSLTRTMTLNTAAFLRGKMRYDFFFVPNSQLWHMFNQFITQRLDKHSTLSKGAKFCPNVAMTDILNMIYSDTTRKDIHGFDWRDNAVRLLDMLGYGNHEFLTYANTSAQDAADYIANYDGKYVNIFRLAAYQHIWYDFYRNKYYDTGDSGDASSYDVGDYVSYFNFDDIDCTSAANSHIACSTTAEKSRVAGLLGQRYVQWKKDLFTSALPGQQFGVVSSVDLPLNKPLQITGSGTISGNTGTDVDRWQLWNGDPMAFDSVMKSNSVGGALASELNGSYTTAQHTHEITGVASIAAPAMLTGSTSFDVLSLYKAEMLQNWKQATLRAGNMTDDNFMAHYGITPRYEGDENVDFLGSFDSPLQVNAVEATTTTNLAINGKVGDLGATGTAVASGNKIQFKARDFGIIMCVASYLPESEYNSLMLDKANTLLEEFDYYTPEFENIGLEAVPFSAYNANVPTSMGDAVLGYAPRYWMYKTAVDKVHGEFAKKTWVKASTQGYVADDTLGSLSPWVAPRSENFLGHIHSGQFARKLNTFYVNPSVLDNVFGVQSSSAQSTDQLLNNVFFDIKSIRPMSVLGLPQF